MNTRAIASLVAGLAPRLSFTLTEKGTTAPLWAVTTLDATASWRLASRIAGRASTVRVDAKRATLTRGTRTITIRPA